MKLFVQGASLDADWLEKAGGFELVTEMPLADGAVVSLDALPVNLPEYTLGLMPDNVEPSSMIAAVNHVKYAVPADAGEEQWVQQLSAMRTAFTQQQMQTQQAQTAQQLAMRAMADASDLGANVQFLLGIHGCEDMQAMAKHFFASMAHYQVSASLQVRSRFGVFNFEADNVNRPLEANLMTLAWDKGRYLDYEDKTLCNYGTCSVLIKNMPLGDDAKYGTMKDNTFAIVQGIDGHVHALDNKRILEDKNTKLEALSTRIRDVMGNVDEAYKQVMVKTAAVVEDMAEQMDTAIPDLSLSEDQEQAIEGIARSCQEQTTQIFNDGLRVDESFKEIISAMDQLLQGKQTEQQLQA